MEKNLSRTISWSKDQKSETGWECWFKSTLPLSTSCCSLQQILRPHWIQLQIALPNFPWFKQTRLPVHHILTFEHLYICTSEHSDSVADSFVELSLVESDSPPMTFKQPSATLHSPPFFSLWMNLLGQLVEQLSLEHKSWHGAPSADIRNQY